MKGIDVCKFFVLISTILVLAVKPVYAVENSFSFGFVPQQSPSVLVKLWGPILKKLSHDTGLTINFSTAPDIPTFEARLAAGEYDFAYMNPLHYTVFSQNPGYRAFGKQKGKNIKGILVTQKDTLIKNLKELDGKEIAFPAPAAFAATILPQSNLSKIDVKFTSKYVGSHDSVYIGVARGMFVAGGGIQRTLETVDPKVKEKLNIFWVSEGYTPHAFAAHPRVPTNVVDTVQRVLLKMFDNKDGKKLLNELGFTQGIERGTDSDWNDVRVLQIDILPK